MTYRIAKPGDIIVEAQKAYPGSFHEKVASSPLMDEFYRKAIRMSGIAELIERSDRTVTVVDVCGGRGRVGEILKEMTKKEFSYVVVDISMRELGKDRWKDRIIGDATHIPLANATADAVFFLNMPVPTSMVERRVARMKPGSTQEVEERWEIAENLRKAGDALYNLNILEGIRVLKPGGSLLVGAKYTGQTRKDKEKWAENLPLTVDRVERAELDSRVIPLWRNYGVDINESVFSITSFTKTHGEIGKLVGEMQGELERRLDTLSETKTFERILEEMKKEMEAKSRDLDELQ
ncbi:MAG: hypothetical protein Sv326_0907 [Candidatus Fermentimicrarchaeum limneticum]|uniref:Uncharacterized protein n=1 Tax=Fermentimicrarchaeum limneticum TaxID=2795018 RepID=A0A7D6BP20_FERL1|nr:MAG: hypothetical protein Sv326_0907 [Candidatus Fermentimicrarchaeum limneticum]